MRIHRSKLLLINCIVGSESVSSVVSRQLLTDLCNHILSLETSVTKDVSLYALVKLQPRAISFEEQVCIFYVDIS